MGLSDKIPYIPYISYSFIFSQQVSESHNYLYDAMNRNLLIKALKELMGQQPQLGQSSQLQDIKLLNDIEHITPEDQMKLSEISKLFKEKQIREKS